MQKLVLREWCTGRIENAACMEDAGVFIELTDWI